MEETGNSSVVTMKSDTATSNSRHDETATTNCNKNGGSTTTPRRQVSYDNFNDDNNNDNIVQQRPSFVMPVWYGRLQPTWGEKLVVPEWQEEDDNNNNDSSSGGYRKNNGWKGNDLIHDKDAAVYIPAYYVQYGNGNFSDKVNIQVEATTTTTENHGRQRRGGVGTRLTGAVYFSERAESHQGYCHGGSMCSVMDDIIGWVGFMVTGQCRPWSGFTVQINTSLAKPIPVQTTLLVTGEVKRIERRKVFIEAVLVDPSSDRNGSGDYPVHAKAEGIVVLNRGVLPPMMESQESTMSTD